MALKSTQSFAGNTSINTELGVLNLGEQTVTNEFYVKVESTRGDKIMQVADVSFAIDGRVVLKKEFSFEVKLDGGNFIAQAYDHLKTLPEFEGAVDC